MIRLSGLSWAWNSPEVLVVADQALAFAGQAIVVRLADLAVRG